MSLRTRSRGIKPSRKFMLLRGDEARLNRGFR